MLEEVFLPVNIPGLQKHAIDWHLPGSFPDVRRAKLLMFGVTDNHTGITDNPVCQALRDLVWDVAGKNPIAHLGIFIDNDMGVGLRKLIGFLQKQYPEARLLIYGLQGSETGLSSTFDALKQLTFFLPSIKTQNFPLLSKVISNLKFDKIIFAGVQHYLVQSDYRKLASYPKGDIWYLRDIDNDQIEVVVRHAAVVWADYRVLARSVTGSQVLPHPAGMDIKQWAAIFYYAGLSPVNRVMMMANTKLEEFFPVDSETVAIGIWHYFEGIKNKIKDYPLLPIQNLEKTEVYVHDYRTYLYHNPQTGRWWIEVPDTGDETRLLPVSTRVALDVSEGRNTDLLLKFW